MYREIERGCVCREIEGECERREIQRESVCRKIESVCRE